MRTRKHRTLGALDKAPELYKQYYKQLEKCYKKEPTNKLKWWEEEEIKHTYYSNSQGYEDRELYQKAQYEATVDRLNLREKVTRFFDKWPAQKLKALTYQCPKHILIKYLNSIQEITTMLLFKIAKMKEYYTWFETHSYYEDGRLSRFPRNPHDWRWPLMPDYICFDFTALIHYEGTKQRIDHAIGINKYPDKWNFVPNRLDKSVLIEMIKGNVLTFVGEFSNRGEEHVINGLEAYIFRTKGLIDNMFIPVAELEFLEQKKK